MAGIADPTRSKRSRYNALWTLACLTCAGLLLSWDVHYESGVARKTSLLTLSGVYDSLSQAPSPKDWSKFQYHAPLDAAQSRSSDGAVACGTTPKYDLFWKLDAKQRSRLNEDQIIYNSFFRTMDQTDGSSFRYLELGAFDGIEESNTRFFDECLGWEGLLIEPNPRIFPKLIKNRPSAHRMSYAASCSESEEAAGRTVGFWASVFTNAAQDESVNREAYANNPKLRKEVPCGSLTPVLLDLFPGGHVNFFSLDTEGTEHLVLQNMDFTRLTFDAIIVESKNMYCGTTCESRDKARAILTEAGYILDTTTVPRSDLYVHPRIRQQAARSAASTN